MSPLIIETVQILNRMRELRGGIMIPTTSTASFPDPLALEARVLDLETRVAALILALETNGKIAKAYDRELDRLRARDEAAR
jgi:hypothetical protein